MGVACPPVSDDPGYTMVDPRCACQEEDQAQVSAGCCSPHVFTSVLLGVLSCVLMTGGVFLAFHRWDPMWLMVSGVGVVLILIGTLLHCCNHLSEKPPRRSSAGKGFCPHHHHPPDHPVLPSGSLTEQLLPLSNARSVSQLSLNMLPGYFPPVVTAYGIEQHSTVVQNISRLVQQQHQDAAAATSPGFIVLSLPADAASANIQNLVATVYHMDGSAVESSETGPNGGSKTNSPASLVLKNVEVQTCSAWPTAAPPDGDVPGPSRSPDGPAPSPFASTQTDDTPVQPETVDLVDCSVPVCDNNACDNLVVNSAALVDIPSDACPATPVRLDVPEPTTLLFDVVVTTPPDVRCSEVLVDIVADGNSGSPMDSALMDAPAEEDVLVQLPDPNLQSLEPELLSSSDHLSDADIEWMERSSPPPSYEDVTLEGESVAASFGLAYGTI